jgi:hypothetical protein
MFAETIFFNVKLIIIKNLKIFFKKKKIIKKKKKELSIMDTASLDELEAFLAETEYVSK